LNPQNFNRLGIELSDQLADNVQRFYQQFWARLGEQGVYADLPAGARIVDVGSGMGMIDIIASQHLDCAKFFLVDGNTRTIPTAEYHDQYQFYNSWSVLDDLVNSTGLDTAAFVKLDQAHTRLWPDQVDLVTSYASWCWHYPLSTYWPQAMASLRPGGRLVIEISTAPVRPAGAETAESVIDRISQDLGSDPVTQLQMWPNGVRCVWIRAR
jgi:SAM-dependent methyltransferase